MGEEFVDDVESIYKNAELAIKRCDCKVVELVGLPGSGKTTLAKKIQTENDNVVILDFDPSVGDDSVLMDTNITSCYDRQRTLFEKYKKQCEELDPNKKYIICTGWLNMYIYTFWLKVNNKITEEEFKKLGEEFVCVGAAERQVIALTVPVELCYNRLQKRGHPGDDTYTIESLEILESIQYLALNRMEI